MTTAKEIRLLFDQTDAQRAWDEWGCNCGPAALAACLGLGLNDVRPHIGDFEEKRYLSPTTMKESLKRCGARITSATRRDGDDWSFAEWPSRGLVRIQWTGPWTAPGANAKWAYGKTHWVASFWNGVVDRLIFDINGGLMQPWKWEQEVAKKIIASIPRADGGFYPTHLWEVRTEEA